MDKKQNKDNKDKKAYGYYRSCHQVNQKLRELVDNSGKGGADITSMIVYLTDNFPVSINYVRKRIAFLVEAGEFIQENNIIYTKFHHKWKDYEEPK